MRWSVVVPAKSLPEAKSRLLPSTAGPQEHAALVRAIRSDTLAAALGADAVARVVVVTDQSPGATDAWADHVIVLIQRDPGLNAALREAAAFASARWPDDGVAALLGDLPALGSEELAAALAAASATDHGFVSDAAGTGTTLLTARPGRSLAPRFGAGSAGRHALAAEEIRGGPGLRRDVDTRSDLAEAADLGVGPATAAALGITHRGALRAAAGAANGPVATSCSPGQDKMAP